MRRDSRNRKAVSEKLEERLLLAGLRADYFNAPDATVDVFAPGATDNLALQRLPVLTKIEAINLDSGVQSPAPGIVNADNFAVRWSGQIKTESTTGTYTFSVETSTASSVSRYRLYVNNTFSGNTWIPGSIAPLSVNLTKDTYYDIRLDYVNSSGDAKARLDWNVPGSGTGFVPVPVASLSEFSSPYVIRGAGIYVGSWRNTTSTFNAHEGTMVSKTNAALRVATNAAVTIANSELESTEHCILIQGDNAAFISNANLTVVYTHGVGLNPKMMGNAPGRFIEAPNVHYLDVEHNRFEGTSGIKVNSLHQNLGVADKVTIKYNEAINIDGRRSDGGTGWLNYNDIYYMSTDLNGNVVRTLWYRGYDRVQFVQLGVEVNTPEYVPGESFVATEPLDKVEVSWNHVVNQAGSSRVEDNISLYGVNGSVNRNIIVQYNYIYGGYAYSPTGHNPTEESVRQNSGTTALTGATGKYSVLGPKEKIDQPSPIDSTIQWVDYWRYNGGGIIAEESAEFVDVKYNYIVNNQNYGIQIGRLTHNALFSQNYIVSTGKLGNTDLFAANAQGIVYAEFSPTDDGNQYGNRMTGNFVGWMKSSVSAPYALGRANLYWSTGDEHDPTYPEPLDANQNGWFRNNNLTLWTSTPQQAIVSDNEDYAYGSWKAALSTQSLSGSLDTTFNGTGVVLNNLSANYDDQATAVARQSDGKVVVAGQFNGGSNGDFFVMRYNADGTIDTNFGGNGTGYRTTTLGGNADRANGLAIDSYDRIVVVGTKDTLVGDNPSVAVARYTRNGALDTTFGNNGLVVTEFSSGSIEYGNAVKIDSAGNIVVAGTWSDGSISRLALLRYTNGGGLDTTFSVDGMLTESGFTGADRGNALSLYTDNSGKITVAGPADNSGASSFFVYRFNANGTLDTTFDTDGKQVVDFGSSDEVCYSMAIQGDGKIVLGGTAGGSMAFARLNTNGSLDGTFSGGRVWVMFDANSATDECRKLIIQPDGKIVAAGGVNITPSPYGNADLGVVRLKTDGSLDTTFGNGGKAIYSFAGGTREVGLDLTLGMRPDGTAVINIVGFQGNVNANLTNQILITQWLSDSPFFDGLIPPEYY